MGEVGHGRPRFKRDVLGRQGRTLLPGCCQVSRGDRSTERDIVPDWQA